MTFQNGQSHVEFFFLDFPESLAYLDYEHMLITFIHQMPRPQKQRFISCNPRVACFKPLGIPARSLDQALLSSDELEALMLADLLGDSQEEGAAKMNISRPTFGRILENGRRTVADALVNGKALQIGGGVVIHTRHTHVQCGRCRRPWNVPAAVAGSFRCPHCQAKDD